MLDTYDFDGDVWLCHSFKGQCHDYTAFVRLYVFHVSNIMCQFGPPSFNFVNLIIKFFKVNQICPISNDRQNIGFVTLLNSKLCQPVRQSLDEKTFKGKQKCYYRTRDFTT